MEHLSDLLSHLAEHHRVALQWFADHAGEETSWPKPLGKDTKLASKAKGIYKPAWTKYALSIRQSLDSPYPDQEPVIRPDGTWSYSYFQENIDPGERDSEYTNRGLVACWQEKVPVGVLRQIGYAPPRYRIIGLALVIGWVGGHFILEGFSPEGWAYGLGSAQTLNEAAAVAAGNVQEVGPQGIPDARERILASIVRRRGQPEFRGRLLEAYESRCAITACGTEEALEAAHIVPYIGPASNDPSNGLLLRADIHTLFDLGLISVDAATMQVVISSAVKDPSYTQLAGLPLRQPKTTSSAPDKAALDQHRKWAGL